MSPWDISSNLPGRKFAAISLLVAALLTPGLPSSATAQERLTQDQALRVAFPAPATIERRTAFLTDAELDSARTLAGSDADITQSVVTYYVARNGDTPVGVAYFDGHTVRSAVEVVMIVVGRDSRVREVEVLRFDEPPEYRATGPWLDQLHDKRLDESLSLKGGVMNLTGASLTSRALVRATRRMLALHQIIHPFQE
jgi:electron transport complex protein RnfG